MWQLHNKTHSQLFKNNKWIKLAKLNTSQVDKPIKLNLINWIGSIKSTIFAVCNFDKADGLSIFWLSVYKHFIFRFYEFPECCK